jgi:hypothetical protein
MSTSKLTELAKERKATEFPRLSKDSIAWFKEKLAEIKRPAAIVRDIVQEKSRRTSQLKLGRLYAFVYDPKSKEDLPYYDKFPLVLILEKYPDGFLGLNLHYLPYKYRVVFLNKLVKYAVTDREDDIVRLRITYDILNASRRFKEFKPCLKRYLFNHMRSRLLAIQPNEWETATLLPLQMFKGATANKVWKESVEEIRES